MVSATARRNLALHIEGERRHDIDALMQPLSDNPRYVLQDLVLEGREAIRAMYEQGFHAMTNENMDEYLQALEDPDVTTWGDKHCVIEYSDGYPLHRNMVVVVHFDEHDKVKSENTYYRGPNRSLVPTVSLADS